MWRNPHYDENFRVWRKNFEFKLREGFLECAVCCGILGHQLNISSKTENEFDNGLKKIMCVLNFEHEREDKTDEGGEN